MHAFVILLPFLPEHVCMFVCVCVCVCDCVHCMRVCIKCSHALENTHEYSQRILSTTFYGLVTHPKPVLKVHAGERRSAKLVEIKVRLFGVRLFFIITINDCISVLSQLLFRPFVKIILQKTISCFGCKHALKRPLIWVDERGVQIPGYSDPIHSLLLTY